MRMPNNPRDPNALWYKLIWAARRAITTGFLAQSDRMGMPGQIQAFWKALGLFWFGKSGWRQGLLLFFLDGSFHNCTQIHSQLCSPHSGIYIVRETIRTYTEQEIKPEVSLVRTTGNLLGCGSSRYSLAWAGKSGFNVQLIKFYSKCWKKLRHITGTWLCHWTRKWPHVTHLTSPSLSFPICKTTAKTTFIKCFPSIL